MYIMGSWSVFHLYKYVNSAYYLHTRTSWDTWYTFTDIVFIVSLAVTFNLLVSQNVCVDNGKTCMWDSGEDWTRYKKHRAVL